MKAIARIMAVLGIAMVLGGGRFAAEAATYYSIGDDDGNGSQSSLCASGPGWAATDGGAKDHCPCADGNDYILQHDCRTPVNGGDYTVKGLSHTLITHKTGDRASIIRLKQDGGKKVIFNNLISINGELTPASAMGMNNPQILAGNLLIPEGGKLRMSIETTAQHSHSLDSKVSGSGEIQIISDIGDKRNIQHHISGDLSEFTGTIRSTGTTCLLRFGKEIAWPSDEFLPEESEAYFDYGNGLTLVLPFSGELKTPRRKVDFGTTMQASVQVGSGCRVGMQSPLKGTMGFIKEGAGELVLEGSGAELSGEIKVTAGTLAISNANAIGSCSLAMTSGSTLTIYQSVTPDGLEVEALPTGSFTAKVVLSEMPSEGGIISIPVMRVKGNSAAALSGSVGVAMAFPGVSATLAGAARVAEEGEDTVLYAEAELGKIYYSIGNDEYGEASLCGTIGGPGWAATDGGAKNHCPCADFNSYAIRHDCRTPEANSDFVVKGYSHTLYTHKTDARASKIQLKLAGGKKVVFNNLISINGELTPSQPYKMDNPQILAGNLLIPEDGKFRMSIEIAYPTEHSHSLDSKVRGSGEIEIFSDLGDKRNIQHHIRGDLSEFTGTIRSTGTTCRLLFGKEIAWPSDEFLPEDSEAYFDYSNGLTLVLPFSGELRTPRRKVDFGTTMQASVQVGSGCRVGMQSPLKGTTGFIKEGAGELVLEGSGEELSGAISVTAGTLAISNANAVGSCSLAMTSGSTLKLYPEATPKGVEVSAFPTGTWALKIVLPVRSRKVLKLPLLRVRDNAAATFGGTISAIEAVVPEGEGPASVGYEVAADGNDTVLYAKVTREKGYTPGLMVIIRGNEAKISD